MASTTAAATTPTRLSSSSSSSSSPAPLIINANPRRPESSAAAAALINSPPPPSGSFLHLRATTAYYAKMARNVIAKASAGEVAAPQAVTATTTPEIVKTLQDAWDKVEDKYAVTSLAVAGGVALWGSVGMISAIEKLPLIPGVLELVGIGYTGWFAYKNLVFQPDREALIRKIKDAYKEITGSSS
ncbi:protein CURVATURE THYLAKOID 1B, chloroplastic [Andrographis paniculata]|uniref:protein CURVATURE THYLAKOID 1B, chloroplastic n=1 Tax=Andrographis paniculata TaxID=175694 RepID=UPI0021E91001|nr:protein CURVATURE THYLAKOID 1B, chloroplastic [Andrographis paniculata]